MVPGEEVTGERQQQGELQQHHADDPIELTGRLIGPVVEDPGHVQEDGQHHEVGRPPVHVADQQAESDGGLQGLDVIPGLRSGRPVEEHQKNTGDREVYEQEEAETTQAEGVADLHRMALHLHRVEVVQHAVHDHVGPVAGAVAVALPEYRTRSEYGTPCLGGLDLFRHLAHATGLLVVSHVVRSPVEPSFLFP